MLASEVLVCLFSLSNNTFSFTLGTTTQMLPDIYSRHIHLINDNIDNLARVEMEIVVFVQV